MARCYLLSPFFGIDWIIASKINKSEKSGQLEVTVRLRYGRNYRRRTEQNSDEVWAKQEIFVTVIALHHGES